MTLSRKSPLRRTPLQQRTQQRPRSSRAPLKATPARRAGMNTARTGPTPDQRAVVLDRSMGACELCGHRLATVDHTGAITWHAAHSVHHRRPRGMGGTTAADINSPANLLLLCGTGTTGCHGWVEAHRAVAYLLGLLVPANTDPETTPVLLDGGDWYLHGHAGGRVFVRPATGDEKDLTR